MLQAEQVLNSRYQLKQKLGQNAGRQTWLASDIKTEPPDMVIVKLLAFGGDVQWDDLKLFEREAQVLKQLNHPRIPKYRDYFSIEERSLWFGLVQEYIPGESLRELLKQGRKFTETEVRQIASEILEILIYLHSLNPPVLHRDIKPSNLIWGEDGKIYLVDFGAVQDRAVAEGATFTVVGTYGYAPLEQFGGRTVAASDLYALGASLIHLASGTSPADLPQRDMRIQFSDFVSLSPSFVSWLKKLTEPALERRFTTAHHALEAIKSGRELNAATGGELLQQSIVVNNSGEGGLFDPKVRVPVEIKSWNWGAFLLTPYWSLTNRVWLGLLYWGPTVLWRFLMVRDLMKSIAIASALVEISLMILLAAKGNEWAWKSSKWRSIAHFKAHQKGWAIASIFLGIPMTLSSLSWKLWFFWHGW